MYYYVYSNGKFLDTFYFPNITNATEAKRKMIKEGYKNIRVCHAPYW